MRVTIIGNSGLTVIKADTSSNCADTNCAREVVGTGHASRKAIGDMNGITAELSHLRRLSNDGYVGPVDEDLLRVSPRIDKVHITSPNCFR
jgi:hypothetical protein